MDPIDLTGKAALAVVVILILGTIAVLGKGMLNDFVSQVSFSVP